MSVDCFELSYQPRQCSQANFQICNDLHCRRREVKCHERQRYQCCGLPRKTDVTPRTIGSKLCRRDPSLGRWHGPPVNVHDRHAMADLEPCGSSWDIAAWRNRHLVVPNRYHRSEPREDRELNSIEVKEHPRATGKAQHFNTTGQTRFFAMQTPISRRPTGTVLSTFISTTSLMFVTALF
jgi:hypothetical protein